MYLGIRLDMLACDERTDKDLPLTNTSRIPGFP